MDSYADYVEEQTEELVGKTGEFVQLYKAGDDDAARTLYPQARTHWERIETVAESFGDLDPKLDLREADVEPGADWTGWHRIEKDLWPQRAQETAEGYTPLTPQERATYADDLMANTQELQGRVERLTYTVDQIANGSRGLLEEVATGKVTGEEEYWSRTDLWDFQANVDGARVGYEGLEPILQAKDPELAETLDDQVRQPAGAARRTEGRRRVQDLRPADARRGQTALGLRQRPLRAALGAHRRRAVLVPSKLSRRSLLGGGAAAAGVAGAFVVGRASEGSAGEPAARPTSYPFRGAHQAGITTAGPGPAALRGLRRHHRQPRRPDRAAPAVDRGRGADDPGRPGRLRRPGRGPLERAARRHRRGDRALPGRG